MEVFCQIPVNVLIQQARLLCKHGEYSSAEITLRKVLNTDQAHSDAVQWLRFCLDAQGRFMEASDLHEEHSVRVLMARLKTDIRFYAEYNYHSGLVEVFDEQDERVAVFSSMEEAEAFIGKQP